MRVFVSHSSANGRQAKDICKLIEKNGHSCFFAPRDIQSGHEYAEELVNGIDSSDMLLLLLSKEANSSPHVLREIERAVSKKIPITVYKLEEVTLSKSMEYFLMSHQWINTKPGGGYDKIISCINEFEEKKKFVEPQTQNNTQKVGNGNAKKIITASVAVAVVAAGVIVGANLINANMGQGAVVEQGGATTQQTDTSAGQTDADGELAKLGDTVIMGEYNGEPIEWRVIKLSDDGTQAVVISKDIITIKAYDAAEGGKYNSHDGEDYWNVSAEELDDELERLIRGDNRWELSNIRTWLNSDKENVEYADNAPDSQSMSEKRNGYNTEAGFLKSFTAEELAAIVTTQVKTGGTVTEDKVFMLSSEELEWLAEADVSKYAKPTEGALEQDKSQWYEVEVSGYGAEDYYWWLRDANASTVSEAYMVGTSYWGGKVMSQSVGLEGFGVRPAMTVDLTSASVVLK